MLRISSSQLPPEESAPPGSGDSIATLKRKRRPAGTPDPDAEVISLSPRTLLESERYVCDICNQSFQRDQNLQMHRRRHKVPWKLMLRRDSASSSSPAAARKRAFVCPDAGCLHHHPRHALGDLVGIKKHFRRKHSANRQWACARCSKAYAVHSDYKAHLRTCGTRGHSCDCGRVFSRVETFIEHQDSCTSSKPRSPPRLSTPSHSLSLSIAPPPPPPPPPSREAVAALTQAESVGREDARLQVEIAERELTAARGIRRQAQAELEKACALRTSAAREINSILLQITCGDCRKRMRRRAAPHAGGDRCSGGDEVDVNRLEFD